MACSKCSLHTCPMVMLMRAKTRGQGAEHIWPEVLCDAGGWEGSPGNGELGLVWKLGFEGREREGEQSCVEAVRTEDSKAKQELEVRFCKSGEETSQGPGGK